MLYTGENYAGTGLFVALDKGIACTYVKSWIPDGLFSYIAIYTIFYRSARVPDGMSLQFTWADGSQNTDWAVLGPGNYPNLWSDKDLRHTASASWIKAIRNSAWPMSATGNKTTDLGYRVI